MRTSVTWLNDYLDPPASAAEQAATLTAAGFPLDGGGTAENGEEWQEIEITSNRGDCLCHVGFAREIAAVTGRTLKAPSVVAASASARESVDAVLSVTNERPDLCPLYTARVVRGVTVRPSPEWLRRRLVAMGLIPRNNLVDATNFVLFELGQPTHVFDLALLKGPEIRVRGAARGEKLLPIGEGAGEVELRPEDLVIADRERAVAIAGVKGGATTAVRDSTRDIVIEAASFDPVAVRATSRALRIASDSSYRFERGVHPAEVDAAAERLVSLILELAGGERSSGVVAAGQPIPAPRTVAMRPARCRRILGIDISDDEILARLTALGFEPRRSGAEFVCTIPARRIDVEREIDLIEEVCRTHGLDAIGVAETIPVRVVPTQPIVAARRATKDLLVGMGFVECVTHSLVREDDALPFLAADASVLQVDDERAGGEPALRPSPVSSLLRVLRRNLDRGGDRGTPRLDLFEFASGFQERRGAHEELPVVALVTDATGSSPAERDECARRLRGAIERVAQLVGGHTETVDVRPFEGDSAEGRPWLNPGAAVLFGSETVGRMGLVAQPVLAHFGIDRPVAAAELVLTSWFERYPPETRATAMPEFPATDRDISAIVDERVRWHDLVAAVRALRLPELERISHVATYRDRKLGERKSVSMRLVFRSHERTLRSEDADSAAHAAVEALRATLGAEIRTA